MINDYRLISTSRIGLKADADVKPRIQKDPHGKVLQPDSAGFPYQPDRSWSRLDARQSSRNVLPMVAMMNCRDDQFTPNSSFLG